MPFRKLQIPSSVDGGLLFCVLAFCSIDAVLKEDDKKYGLSPRSQKPNQTCEREKSWLLSVDQKNSGTYRQSERIAKYDEQIRIMKPVCHSSRSLRSTTGATKTIRNLFLAGVLVIMAIADLTFLLSSHQSSLFRAQKSVSALTSTSHRGRRASLFEDSRRKPEVVKRRNRNRNISILSQSVSAISTEAPESSKTNGLLVRLLTGEKASPRLQKPKWLEKSSKLSALPTWLFHLRPSVQMLVTIFLYLFHTTVLTQNSIILPIQIFPNDRGNFQSIGLDT